MASNSGKKTPWQAASRLWIRGASLGVIPRPTATAARRRRPTSKETEVATPAERRRAATARRTKTAIRNRSRHGVAAAQSVPHEDKRESPAELGSDVASNNSKVDRNDKKSKGKSTHDLEVQAPGTRPSRKSTRRGANHIKPEAQKHRQTTRAVRSPKRRHAMRGA
jgi:hypothetical protein